MNHLFFERGGEIKKVRQNGGSFAAQELTLAKEKITSYI